MGGGILRNLAKAAVASAPTAARQSGLSSLATRRCAMVQSQSPPSLRLDASHTIAAEDWELFPQDEDFGFNDRLVFGSAPSRVEVEEATNDLENALGTMCNDYDGHSSSNSNIIEVKPNEVSAAFSDVSQTSSQTSWIEPHFASDVTGNVQVRRRSDMMDAFRLLQNDSTVKGVVMSIASDKAVWDAVLSNEKVKELRTKLAQPKSTEVEGAAREEAIGLRFIWQILDYSANVFHRLQDAVKELVESLLSFVDKTFSGDNSSTDKNRNDAVLKSCFMLGVMVVSIVILKRAA